jgi:hypothetical protein
MTEDQPMLSEGEDETEDERLFREDQKALVEALVGVMEERGLDEGQLAAFLVGEMYHYRAISYVTGTAKPSEAGLRLDLDRLRKEIEEVHREYRKHAGDIVKDIVAALDSAEEDEEENVKPTSILSDGSGR